MTTLMLSASVVSSHPFGLRARFDQLAHALTRTCFALARRGQRTINGEIMCARDQQVLGWKTRDYFVSRRCNNNLFFNARRAPAVLRRPEGLEREYHSGLDFAWMLFGHQFANYRFLPDR